MKIHRTILLTAILLILLICNCEKVVVIQTFPSSEFILKGSFEGEYWPTESWKTCKPEEVGMDSDKLKELNEEILLLLKLHVDINSVIIVKNGYIVAEQYYSDYYGVDSLHSIYSCTKSLISALMGMAIEQEYIPNENVSVTDFFPEYEIENLSPEKQQISLKHMLTMSAGLEWYEMEYLYGDERNTYRQWVLSDDRVKFVLDRPMLAVPGTEYSYNSGISQVLSAVIQKSTGIRTDSFALENLFAPLGIENYYWPIDKNNVAYGGGGLRLKPRDMAKFGYMYLKKGEWDEKQIVPKLWVEESQKKQIKRKYIPYYYGYHWWVSEDKSYSAVGFGGQWIKVFPEDDLVVVFTNHFKDGDEFQWSTVERLVNLYVLPAINS